jgi:serine/threonine protein kinase
MRSPDDRGIASGKAERGAASTPAPGDVTSRQPAPVDPPGAASAPEPPAESGASAEAPLADTAPADTGLVDTGPADAAPGDDSGFLRRLREAAAPVPMGLEAGFELIEEIGRGGQGVVYRAREAATGLEAAVKRLYLSIDEQRDATARERIIRRLRREVAIASTIDDPRIAAARRIVEEHGRLYAVMPLVRGRRADRWACEPTSDRSSPRRSARETAAMMRAVCDAIGAAHRRGVVHRDLKPSNILVGDDAMPVIVDFGLALRSRPEPGASFSHGSLTGGEFAGTVAYAAPEVLFDQRTPDGRADVYSLGSTLYELLTGVTAHGRGSSFAAMVIDRARSRAVPPPSLAAGASALVIDPALDAIVLRAMADDPSARHADAAELAADLGAWLGGTRLAPASARPVLSSAPRRSRRSAVRIAAVAAVGVAAAVLAWFVFGARHGADDAPDGGRDVARTLAAVRAAGVEHFQRGDRDRADRLFRAAMDLIRSTPRLPVQEVHDTLRTCSSTSRYPHEFRVIAQECERLRLRASRETGVEPGLIESIDALSGTMYLRLGEQDAALREFGRRGGPPESGTGLFMDAWIESRLGESEIHKERGEHARAAGILRDVLTTCERFGRVRHASAVYASSRLGLTMVLSGDADAGLERLRAALDLHRSLVQPDHPDLCVTQGNLGIGLLEAGDPRAAVEHLRAAFDRGRRELGFDHPHTLKIGANLTLAMLAAPRDPDHDADAGSASPDGPIAGEFADGGSLGLRIEEVWALIGWRSDAALRSRLRTALAATESAGHE